MLKTRNLFIFIVIYILSFIAIKGNINIFYPYYYLKDLIYFPVLASSKEVELDSNMQEGIEMELRKELEELKNLHNIDSTLGEFTKVNAMIIERNKMYWFNTLTINKGKSSGIKEDMAVITGKGLLGRISKVGNNTSEVKLITTNDVNHKISVMIKTNDNLVYGILSGYEENNNTLQVISSNKDESIKSGDFVYTSGMGGIFPSGILIGQVLEIIPDKYEVSKVIQVTPSTNIQDLRFVSVLIRE